MYNSTGIAILAAIGILIAGREFFCWYFKINERLKIDKERNALLQKIVMLNNTAEDKGQGFKIEPE